MELRILGPLEVLEEGRHVPVAGARQRALLVILATRANHVVSAEHLVGGLWRGPALGEFAYEPFAQSEIARLEELRLQATEDRAEAELACGRHAVVVGDLEGLVASHPYRERLRAQLMVSLYRSGRQAEAL